MERNAPAGRIAENIMYFARLVRSAGIPVGSGKVLDAIKALQILGIGSQEDLYWALFSHFVSKNDERELFDQAFSIFWRNPHIMERMMGMMLPTIQVDEDDLQEISKRLSEVVAPQKENLRSEEDSERIEFDASFTFSNNEVLQEKDFEDMSSQEIDAAKRAIKELRLPILNIKTRRYVTHKFGKLVDMRNTLRASLRSPGSIPLSFKSRRQRHPPIVILCDISGSMTEYSRMFLHFMHAVTNDRDRVHCFVFGTRLTNISRHLKHKDIDLALDKSSHAVKDWSGGTRIGVCLKQFNNSWSRRVLSQGAVCILVTDGLDRDEADGLEKEIERLSKSARQLIWLNPLLRFDGFEPKAKGIKTMLPYVDEFKTAHNLKGLLDLSKVLSRPMKDRRVYSEIFNA
jgi:uncharacterized protein with von Willebrand factor type A (vWA) domain